MQNEAFTLWLSLVGKCGFDSLRTIPSGPSTISQYHPNATAYTAINCSFWTNRRSRPPVNVSLLALSSALHAFSRVGFLFVLNCISLCRYTFRHLVARLLKPIDWSHNVIFGSKIILFSSGFIHLAKVIILSFTWSKASLFWLSHSTAFIPALSNLTHSCTTVFAIISHLQLSENDIAMKPSTSAFTCLKLLLI